MKTAAVIAEYNPFHNGHSRHLKEARALTGADFVMAVMRGTLSRGALRRSSINICAPGWPFFPGADLVLEMPIFGSVASAEDFASCGVSMAARTGAADFLSFGSESGDLKLLNARPPFTRRKHRRSLRVSGRG